MKALVYTAPRRLELQEFPTPPIRSDEVLVRVRAAGVCGSDVDGFLGNTKKRVPPLVLGHEFSGEIVQLGRDVSEFRVGEAVAVYPLVTCGQCKYCKTGREHICPHRKVYGLDFHGGFAEFVAAPRQCLFRMATNLSFLEGALVEPVANAIHVMSLVPQVIGATGLVYGAGSIGMLVSLVAKYFGAERIAVVDVNPHRLSRLKELGADLLIDASTVDPVDAILEWTGGSGVDFAVDAVGKAKCRANTVACLAPGGTAVWIGLGGEMCEIDGRAIVTREIEVKGSYAYRLADFSHALSIAAQKKLPVETVVSEAGLQQGQSIFEDLASSGSRLMKVIFKF